MGLQARWTITCDGCGKVQKMELTLNERNWDGTLEHEEVPGRKHYVMHDSIWTPGIPDGWLQVPQDKETGRQFLFFHDDECYDNWLRQQERIQEAEAFRNAVWIA